MKANILQGVKLLVSLAFGLAIIYYLQRNLSPEESKIIQSSFQTVDKFCIFLIVVTAILACILRTLRWKMLLKPLGYVPRFKIVLSSIFIMYLANLLFPRLGEVTRCTILQKYEDIPFEKSVGTMIVERLVDMLCFGLVVILALVFEFDKFKIIYDSYLAQKQESSWIIYLIPIGIIILLFFLWRIPKVKNFIIEKIQGILEGLKSILKLENPVLFIIYSLLIFVLYFAAMYILYFAIEGTQHLSFQSVFLLLIAGTLAVGLTQAGLGAYQLLVTQALELYSIPKSIGLAYSWIAWLVQNAALAIAGILGWIYLSLTQNDKRL